MEQVRLNKYLASCGVCSRREADRLIEQGRVQINGETALVGQSVTAEDEIKVNKKLVQGRSKRVVLAYYKPIGVVCTEKDKYADKKVTDMIKYPMRVTYAGRLDKDSEGLLLLTNDGDLINTMMRGANRHEKEYVVKVDKKITPAFLSDMEKGVYLKELELTTRPCEIREIGPYTFQIILTQGVNRQIRRMCETLGYQVKSLKRIRVMSIRLDGLKPGEYRELNSSEMEQLYRECKMLNCD
ncbi:MAG: pseudouridine synthase [Lachnospiraceae bacterium]|nr:pseudouridine synthase [Lachnospiraceae bacterium]